MTADFKDRIHLGRGVAKITRTADGVLVRDEHGVEERFDQVILACNANQALLMLAEPSAGERVVLGAVRYESELHNHAVVHTDAAVLPDDDTKPLETRSNWVMHYGSRPDNYEITYIMHNQQPWAKSSDRPCPRHGQRRAAGRPGEGGRAHVVSARRARRLPHRRALERVSLLAGKAPHLVLRRTHDREQPRALLHFGADRRSSPRSGLPLWGKSRCEKLVQLLRATHARAFFPRGLSVTD